ncbi:IEV morphogenesis [NY_014 poxvirus]|uniref:IEV morphogenesis n=1 Tax=NY_014 poxvirus TaxID=2025360 RepID=UPI000B9A0114|nr:IEV morphogenesis [NY_014 poxvirus]AST09451.1 IEV morphogenesis [NY_014 poxvirus]
MISVTELHDSFLKNNCNSITKAFGYIPNDRAIELTKIGFHPLYLPKSMYNDIVEFVPEKLYLFKSHIVKPLDLLSILIKLKKVEKFSSHINYHKNIILKTGDKDLIIKCMYYMIISDDDIRYIRERFSKNVADYILSFINKSSIYRMSYQLSEDDIVNIINRDHFMYEAIYEHQTLTSDFLKNMLDIYGIAPINQGIKDELVPEVVIEILMAIVRPRDAIHLLDMVHMDYLIDDSIKNFIINDIKRGKIEYYIPYAEEFLEDRIEDLGIYANVFFDNVVDITKVIMTDSELEHITKYIRYYTNYIEFIVNVLIRKKHMDLLASIIDYIPDDMLTEELCIRIVCESTKHVPINSLPIHSTLVMIMCIQMKYVDIVEFLDEIDIDTLIEKGADPITEYTFSTKWYNKQHDLITLYVKKYGFCPEKMRKLMFEYPLTKDASTHLLKVMNDNKGAIMFFPHIVGSLPYLLCYNYKIIQRPIPFKEEKTNIQYKKTNRILCFDSLDNHSFKSLIKIDSIPGLKTCNMKNITYEKSNNQVFVKFNPQELDTNDEKRIKLQIFDIARLASYGLFYIPYRYLPSWTPVVNMIEGNEYTNPQKIECVSILDLFSEEFIEYENLGNVVSNKYELEYSLSNYQAAINSLMGTLLTYLVIGSITYANKTDEFVISILNIFYRGLKINEVITDQVTGVCDELDNIKNRVSSDTDTSFIFLKKKSLTKTLLLCEKVCIEIILDNNQSFKS